MKMPNYTAEASLYGTGQYYRFAASWGKGADGQPVLPQQEFVAPIPGSFPFHCSRCTPHGWQICCPPPGFGLRCFIRRCLPPP